MIFISYARKDHFFVELVRDKLREAGIEVWIDRESLLAGDEWRGGIDRGIADCQAVVVVLSEAAAASHYVTYEWASALGQYKTIIPVLLEPCTRHPKLAPIQHLDFTSRQFLPWDILVKRVREVIEEGEAGESLGLGAADADDGHLGALTDDQAVKAILRYLDSRGFRMVSFGRLRDKLRTDADDAAFAGFVSRNRDIFHPARLKGGKPGLKRL